MCSWLRSAWPRCQYLATGVAPASSPRPPGPTSDGTLALRSAYILRLHSIGNTVNETFWGLWLVPFGTLVYRSGFLPRFLGAWLVVNGAAYVALSGIGLMRPELSGKAFLYAQPLLFGELAIMLWLIIKGAMLKQLAATA